MHLFRIFSVAFDSKHIFHPFQIAEKGDEPTLARRILGIGLLILTIPLFCLGTGAYLFWANRKLQRIEERDQANLDKRVQKIFKNNQTASHSDQIKTLFSETIQDIQQGKTKNLPDKVKQLSSQNPEIHQQLIRTAIAYNRTSLIPPLLENIECERDLLSILLSKAKSAEAAAEIINSIEGEKRAAFLSEPWDVEGNTALHKVGNPHAIKALIENGAVYQRNTEGDSPLHTCKDPNIAEFLAKTFPDELNSRNNKGETALFTAPISVKKVLLKKGANPNAADREKRTILHCCEDVEVAKLLIDNGVELKKQDKNGKTAFQTNPSPGVKKLLIDAIAKTDIHWINRNITIFGNTTAEECQLFCFGEIHTDDAFRDYFAQVVQKHYREGDVILVEGVPSTEKIHFRNSKQSHKLNDDYLIYGWEPENYREISVYFNKSDEIYDRMLRFGESVEKRLSGMNPSNDREWDELQAILDEASDKIEEFNRYYRSNSTLVINARKTLQDFYNCLRNKEIVLEGAIGDALIYLITKILKKLENCQEKALYANLTKDDLQEIFNLNLIDMRNDSLVGSINGWLEKGSKVFVIAGVAHFLNTQVLSQCKVVQECIQTKKFILSSKNRFFGEKVSERNPALSQLPSTTISDHLFDFTETI